MGLALELPRPPEPSMQEIRDRADGDGDDERIAGQQMPGWLWSNHWKDPLESQDLDWHEFQSEISPAIPAIKRWARGDQGWDHVVDRVGRALRADIE